nr:hypothetical protein [Tanacetum cinerariifolium]
MPCKTKCTLRCGGLKPHAPLWWWRGYGGGEVVLAAEVTMMISGVVMMLVVDGGRRLRWPEMAATVDQSGGSGGYEDYNAVPPHYTGNFMPPTPELSYTSLDEFVNKPMSSKEDPKVVRKNNDALIIEEWVSNDEEDNGSQPKIEKKTVNPSIVKKVFVKPKQQKKTTRKTVKHVEKNRQNTNRSRGNQRN